MKCEECTMCCELLPIKSLNKPANILCNHCELKKGCKIYGVHPLECSSFECAYSQIKKAHEDLRPDKCKIIFEKISDNIFFGTQNPKFQITNIGKQQINEFKKEGFSVILSCTLWKDKMLFLSNKHTEKQINNEFKKYLNKNGSTNIH